MTSRKTKPKDDTREEPIKGGDTAPHSHLDHSSLSQNEVTILAETFRLLGDPSRLKILLSCLPGPISVGDIAEKLELSLTLVSHHLRLLRGARLVKGERQGKHIFYAIADEHVSQVLQDMATHIAEDHADD
ncbi:ArsR/SmtB family transcription factor [Pseudaminobacter sp. NGMCC 1.201702]|uniref:ArsR/SmtB family transcription factor n=1 Tax=Pseudaminobacter sp. NGMCC 1.201702 TaxID=3391825 RepID=UPI0039EF5A50